VHGGQVWPSAQPGQAQPQPPPPPAGSDWQTPDLHIGSPGAHGAPIAYHTHLLVVSAEQAVLSACTEQGSGAVPPPMPTVPVGFDGSVGAGTAPPEPHEQPQGGQVWPGAQSGQAHVQVPSSTQPAPGSHVQTAGGQV
jgi:hypothetical protein